MSSSSMHPLRGLSSPPSEARAIICIPTDQTGEALIAMLQKVSRVSRDNDHRLVDSSSRLSARFPPRSGRGHRSAQGPNWLSSLCDLSTRWRSAIRAITCLRQIWFAVLWSTVEAGSFLLTVFDDFGTDEWRKMLRSQHAVDQLHGQPIILMASL